MAMLFFDEEGLDVFNEKNQIVFQKPQMFLEYLGVKYQLVEALKFVAEVSGSGDIFNLGGKVYTKMELQDGGAEVYGDSVIFKECAYNVINGYLGFVATR